MSDKNNIRTVSLFSGGGGLDLGFIRAGFDIVYATDSDPNACATYRANIGEIDCADITAPDPSALPDCSLVIGGPPCQAFSLIGKRDPDDPRASLVWSYLDIVRALSPDGFLMENVQGLLSARTKEGRPVLENLKAAFGELGYTVSAAVLDASDYGVPQRRKRVFLAGLRGRPFVFPEPVCSRPVTVAEALSDLPEPGVPAFYPGPPRTGYQRLMREGAGEEVSDHGMPRMSGLDRLICRSVRPGGNYMDIPPDVESRRIRRLQREGGHTTLYGRLHPDRPAYTINTLLNRPGGGCHIHYSQDRLVTLREAMRLQSFPDTYRLVSSSMQGKLRIVGNAVPPLLAQALAGAMAEQLK